MSRKKRNTTLICGRVDNNVIESLLTINPSLAKHDSSTTRFRHGAIGKYLERLIRADIEERKKMQEDELLGPFLTGEKTDGL